MLLHSGNFHLQQRDPRIQLIKRIAVESLARKPTGGVALGAWLAIVIHGIRFGCIPLAVNR